jgi:hypothetical protein
MSSLDRRRFLAGVLALLLPAGAGAAPRCPRARRAPPPPHPAPRPNVDASRVLTRAQLGDHAEAAEVFDLVRRIPRVADGIRCTCGCAELPGYRSLLSCFEGDGMARHCEVCQGQARLAHDLHAAGRPLAVIRLAIDRRFR